MKLESVVGPTPSSDKHLEVLLQCEPKGGLSTVGEAVVGTLKPPCRHIVLR